MCLGRGYPPPPSLRRLILKVVRVDLGVFGPLSRKLILGKASIHRAGLDAGIAVDALVRIDVELLDVVVVGLVRGRVDAVDRADLDTGVVLLADARFGDDVGQGPFPFWSLSGFPAVAGKARGRANRAF